MSYQAESFMKDDSKERESNPTPYNLGNNNKPISNLDFEPTKDEKMHSHFLDIMGKTKQLIIPLFCVIAFVGILFGILGMTEVWDDPIGLLLIVGAILIGSFAGAYGIYKWGTIQMTIDRLSNENDKFANELDLMRINASNLKSNVNGLQTNVNELQRDTEQLNDALHEFDDLRKSLNELSSDNQNILNLVSEMNNVYSDMHSIIISNEKAKLFEMYYDVELRDGSKGLTSREYQRLLGRLSSDQRSRLENIATFKEIAGNDNILSFNEFQGLVQKCLDSYESEIIRKESNKMIKHGK